MERILQGHPEQPLRRYWIDHPCGEEEVAHLEEEVLPAITACLKRIDEIDARLQVREAARSTALPPSWPVDHPPATA